MVFGNPTSLPKNQCHAGRKRNEPSVYRQALPVADVVSFPSIGGSSL